MSSFSPDTVPAPAGPCDCRTIEPTKSGEPMGLIETIEHEAIAYRAWGTPTGDFLADQMERVAQLIRWTGATTPQQYDERMEVWDRQIRDQWFEDGRAAGQKETAEHYHFGPCGKPLGDHHRPHRA